MSGKDLNKTITELMRRHANIRNIGIVAHIDHGKCVAGSTRVMLTDGRMERAENLFDAIAKDGDLAFKDSEKTIFNAHGRFVYALNRQTGRFEPTPVKYAWKLRGGRVLKVRLRNGLGASTTPEHKYVVFDGKDFADRPASELQVGDRVVCARELPQQTKADLKSETIGRLAAAGGFYAKLKPDMAAQLHSIAKSAGESSMKIITGLKRCNFMNGARRGRYRLSDLANLASIAGIDARRLYDGIETISYRSGGDPWRARSSNRMRLPHSFGDMFYLAGMLFGDGHDDKLIAGKEELGLKFQRICMDLGLKPYWRRYDRCPEVVSGGGTTITKVMGALFDYPTGRKSHIIRVSEFMASAPQEYIASFLRGYFDCDGTVEKARRAVSISSASSQMLSDVQLLLLRFGCVSIRQGNTLYLSGRSAISFKETIGFELPEKQTRLEALCKTARASLVSDLLPAKQLLNGYPKSADHHLYKYASGCYVPDSATAQRLAVLLKSQGHDTSQLEKLLSPQLAYIEVAEISEDYAAEVFDFSIEPHKNFVAEGVVIHNTTLTDTLLAGAGMLSEALAGTACVMDFDPQEKERGITIYAANASMVHSYNNKDYLINLIDTPGHVDFGGDVSRAMRAVDGVIVLSDAVEGIMPQTETVIRQALRERVKPILFINKVDRFINELKLTPEQMQQRFLNIINGVNNLIQKYAEEEYKTKWMVNINDGSVAFGSAKKKWAISVPLMKEAGISFKDIIDLTSSGREDELAKKAPLYKVILDMVIRHLPDPEQAQKYRVPKLWPGDIKSEDGKSMTSCNPDGPLAAIITKVYPTQHSGYVATVRIFSGKIVAGQEVFLIGKGSAARVQQVGVYRGQQRLAVDEVDAGNIVGVVGLKDASSGETLCAPDHKILGFEAIKHIFEPVVTKAIEPKKPQDLTRLIEFLKKTAREDPTLQVKINEETGEYLVSGLGELHLDAKVERKLKDEGIEVSVSPPIVIYNESVKSMTREAVEGKSPNKHNRFYVIAAPLEKSIYDAMVNGDVPSDLEVKGRKDQDLVEKLVKHGMDRDQAKSVKLIRNKSVFMEMTRGVTAILEVMELCKEAFKESMDEGPLGREPCAAVKIMLVDAKLHEDTIHRGPAQVIPAMRRAIRGAMVKGGAYILEPKQIIRIDVPTEQMGGATREVGNRRGQIMGMTEERGVTSITTKIPVAEMFGFNSALKSSTGGLGFFWLIDIVYEPLPRELQDKVVRKIRERKGLTEEQMRVGEDEDE